MRVQNSEVIIFISSKWQYNLIISIDQSSSAFEPAGLHLLYMGGNFSPLPYGKCQMYL